MSFFRETETKLQPIKSLILQRMLGHGETIFSVSSCKDTVGQLVSQAKYLSMTEEQSQIFIQELERWSSIWITKRKATVRTLRVHADELMEHHKNVCVANVAGSSVSIAGFAAVATGFGLSFVTFGASLALALYGAGAVVGAAGGLVNLGSSLTEGYLQKKALANVQKIIEEDREAISVLQKLLEEAKQPQNKLILEGIWMGCKGARMLETCARTGYKIGVRVGAQAVSEGGETLFRSLKMAERVAHVGGFVVSAALLPLDIYTVVKNAIEIDAVKEGKKDIEPEVVKKVRAIADELESELTFLLEQLTFL